MKKCYGLFLFLVIAGALAQSGARFPDDRISPQQWQQYFDEIRALPGAEIQDVAPGRYTVIFKDDATYFFTSPSHPAHPAVVKREAIEKNKELYLGRQGHFAGDEKAFAQWWDQFDEMDRQAKERIEKARSGTASK